jgi:hypothetical protein
VVTLKQKDGTMISGRGQGMVMRPKKNNSLANMAGFGKAINIAGTKLSGMGTQGVYDKYLGSISIPQDKVTKAVQLMYKFGGSVIKKKVHKKNGNRKK